jgi:hypothetical protein
MSQHHRRSKWSTDSPKFRKIITAALPQPCVDCGRLVTAQDKWQVGHRPGHEPRPGRPAPTINDVGPSHTRSAYWPRNCNQIAGGRIGAAVTNSKRKARKDIREW